MGWLVHHVGFRGGFAVVAAMAALALPSFLFMEGRLGFRNSGTLGAPEPP
jgi:hypothetical protein